MTKTTKKILLRYIVAPLIMLIFLWVIYLQLAKKGDLNQQWQELVMYWHLSPWYLSMIVILMAPINWMWEAIKWKLVMKKISPVSFLTSFRAILTGIAFAMVTPGKVGDFAGRILYVPKSKRWYAIMATLMTNAVQVVATSTVGVVGLIYILSADFNEWLRQFLWIFIWVVLGLILCIYIFKKLFWQRLLQYKSLHKFIKLLQVFKRFDKQQLCLIYVLSICRFLTYNIQFFLLANMLGSQMPILEGLMSTFVMFWMITIIPSLFVSDIGVRGFLATMLFIETGLAINGVSLISASYIIWLVNLIVPSVIGSLLILFIKKINHEYKRESN